MKQYITEERDEQCAVSPPQLLFSVQNLQIAKKIQMHSNCIVIGAFEIDIDIALLISKKQNVAAPL